MPRFKTATHKSKRSLVLALSEDEMRALERIAAKRGLTKSGLLRQALRLYESVEERLEQGQKLYLESPNKKEKMELILL